jgi:hypothetical protein
MKKTWFLILMISLIFFSGSCKKDSNGNTIYKMSATIDGKQWTALLPGGVLSAGYFVITGTSLTGETIIITAKGEVTGTYELSVLPPKAECLGTYKATLTSSSADTYASTSGKIVITKVDKTNKLVSGTFEFTLANTALTTKQITIGTFNDVTFISQ